MNTILFGAGASIPFFKVPLTTGYITNKILDIDNWQNTINKLNSVNHNNYQLIELSEISPVFNQFNLLRSKRVNLNFEDIAEVIDKISSYGYDSLPKSNIFNVIQFLFQPKILLSNRWNHVPFLLREIIANVILDFHKNNCVKNYDELIILQKKFIQTVGENEISVVSLNYDDNVPTSVDALGNICYHFTDSTNRHENMLNVKEFLLSNRVAYFPHGHLRFVFTDELNVSYVRDIEQAENLRWNGLFNRGGIDIINGPFSYDFNTFITTGKTKDNSFNNLPFSVYYQRLALDFLHSTNIYIVGYSFNDAHINRLLKGFLNINMKNKVYIIDKYDSAITMVDEYKDNSNLITKIQETFRPNWNIIVDSVNSKKMPYDQNEVDNVNTVGYGKIFDRIVFYKKGYCMFLNEFRQVLSKY